MIARETVAFLESGCVLIVCTASPDGEPHATRGWGLTVVDDEDGSRVRLLLDADDEVTIANVGRGALVAITGGCVRTFQSTQLKGRAVAVEPANPVDDVRADAFVDDMATTINDVDGTPKLRVTRLRPSRFAACTVAIDEFYDQTPGPGAGAAIDVESR